MSHRRVQAPKPTLHEEEDMEEQESEMAPLSLEEEYQREKHALRVKRWKESPFAVGLTECTWMDERSRPLKPNVMHGDSELAPDHSGCLCCSAKVCPLLGAGRVGNMIVLRQSQFWVEEEVVDEETGDLVKRKVSRPSLDIVVGPYWPMLVFVTYPLILGVSFWTFLGGIMAGAPKPFGKTSVCTMKLRAEGLHVVTFTLTIFFLFLTLVLVAMWLFFTVSLVASLTCTACRDPGILYRQTTSPESTWRWSDQAQTYRPPGAYYDPDSAVIVEDFDHTLSQKVHSFHCFPSAPHIVASLQLPMDRDGDREKELTGVPRLRVYGFRLLDFRCIPLNRSIWLNSAWYLIKRHCCLSLNSEFITELVVVAEEVGT